MAEPWLDSLSEDWKSEHQSSSPRSSVSSIQQGSVILSKSQSRIPHLAQSLRKDSSSGSFIKPRSSRGIARAKNESILSERSASSLNLPGSRVISQKRLSSTSRYPSSVFSESQNSVQHHSINVKPDLDSIPEWKRRLANGEDIASDGFDLFAPTKLEGMFKEPSAPTNFEDAAEASLVEGLSTALKPFELPPLPATNEQYQSLRASRSRPIGMEVLEEVDEEEEAELNPDRSLNNNEVKATTGSTLAHLQNRHSRRPSLQRLSINSTNRASIRQDPRWRTLSGQQEVMNEHISPVTTSRRTTIVEKVLSESLDLDIETLHSKLAQMTTGEVRPASRSSDDGIVYGEQNNANHNEINYDLIGDLTSLSLPEDLSMGTQEFVSRGGYINQKRGGVSTDVSLLQKALTPLDDSHFEPDSRLIATFRSSPPPYKTQYLIETETNAEVRDLMEDTSNNVVEYSVKESKQTSSKSPLKLFGNRDTYTNKKLMRILDQFENGEDSEDQEVVTTAADEKISLKISQFGQGDLDDFDFGHEVTQPVIELDRDRHSKPMTTFPIIEQDYTQATQVVDNAAFMSSIRMANNIAGTQVEPNMVFPSLKPSPKRRRTLVKDSAGSTTQEVQVNGSIEELTALAGTKRKDARPGDDGTLAEPEILASRSLLQPRSTRKSQSNDDPQNSLTESQVQTSNEATNLTEALANELASFAKGVADIRNDSRKPSLATRDYMEEANKVMQFIRAKGKPKPAQLEVDEPSDISELDPDAILDLSIDDESTKDEFSRPPSREGNYKPIADNRVAKHDPQTTTYLRKFREQEETDLLGTTSALGSLHLSNHRVGDENLPITMQESDPPNIRILNHDEMQRKRKHSNSTVEATINGQDEEGVQGQNSLNESSRRSIPTSLSSGSGHKGMITSGTISIPDHVGTMTFDHNRKIWVKKALIDAKRARDISADTQITSDHDPFDSIPDLSIDEKREAEVKAAEVRENLDEGSLISESISAQSVLYPGQNSESVKQQTLEEHSGDEEKMQHNEEIKISSLRSEVSKHEARLHDGLPSSPPKAEMPAAKQPRVVTIAFSSPVVSAVQYQNDRSLSDIELEEDDDLPLDDSIIEFERYRVAKKPGEHAVETSGLNKDQPQDHSNDVLSLHKRPISRIDEVDEDEWSPNKSLVHVKDSNALTPAPPRALTRHQIANKASSILCLTPLSDFTIHQIDNGRNPELSYVEERANPKALRQAHGSLTLAVDTLIKAITDAEPSELYWERIRSLKMVDRSLSSLHGLKDYCSSLEELSVYGNHISHLGGVPSSIRHLDIHANSLTNLTSWTHLQNLQYVNVSGNQIDNLDGFSSLIHLRSLDASNNRIQNINGVLHLDALLTLNLHGNEIVEVDFEDATLDHLEVLDLSNNKIRVINNLHYLPTLKELNICANKLQHFTDTGSIGLLQLIKLDASRNDLQHFDLTQLQGLRELCLDNNDLCELQGLEAAYHLERLSLRQQKKSSDIVNTVLSTPNECRRIFLSMNLVKDGQLHLPHIQQCNLRELEIAGCGISDLPLGLGDYFPNCRELNMNFNAIKDISQLQGMEKLSEVYFARNRVKRLRRTCLMLAKLPMLKKVDMRDNPLTVGFYDPITHQPKTNPSADELLFLLSDGCAERDRNWRNLLDEVTSLKRRIIELLMAEKCPNLECLDGMKFDHGIVTEHDDVWQKLQTKNVLVMGGQDDSPGMIEENKDDPS